MISVSDYYQQALNRVKKTPEPKGQKFPIGTRVRIADDLGSSMSHFPKGVAATVMYTYGHAYDDDDVKNYCLDIDGIGKTSWYYEHQLTAIDNP